MISILVVDDEERNRSFLTEALTRSGYRGVAVESGEAALALLAEQTFDLALLDLQFGLDGLELLKRLRQQWPNMVVIVLTAQASPEAVVEALRQGAYDYLSNPYRPALLRHIVHQAMHNKSDS